MSMNWVQPYLRNVLYSLGNKYNNVFLNSNALLIFYLANVAAEEGEDWLLLRAFSLS